MFSRFRSLLTRRAGRARSEERLVRCPGCGHDAVHPVWWEAVGEEHWWIALRCGECGARREELVTNAVASRFDRDLDRARDEIVDEAERLGLEILSTQADALAVALERDLIGVDDFAPGPCR
jgi:transcription elongation factor Elf1